MEELEQLLSDSQNLKISEFFSLNFFPLRILTKWQKSQFCLYINHEADTELLSGYSTISIPFVIYEVVKMFVFVLKEQTILL